MCCNNHEYTLFSFVFYLLFQVQSGLSLDTCHWNISHNHPWMGLYCSNRWEYTDSNTPTCFGNTDQNCQNRWNYTYPCTSTWMGNTVKWNYKILFLKCYCIAKPIHSRINFTLPLPIYSKKIIQKTYFKYNDISWPWGGEGEFCEPLNFTMVWLIILRWIILQILISNYILSQHTQFSAEMFGFSK